MATNHDMLLRVEGLTTRFFTDEGLSRAVEDVSFEVPRGRTVALVGESGCGKTTAGKALLQLIRPTAGNVLFKSNGQALDLTTLSRSQLKPFRRKMQLVFQDPYSSLNPRMMVGTKAIATLLNVSVKTVEFHKSRIMQQLDIHTTADLTKYAITHGITGL